MIDFKVGDVVVDIQFGDILRLNIPKRGGAPCTIENKTKMRILNDFSTIRHATLEEREEFYRMQEDMAKEETTEQQPEPTYKVGDDVLVTGRITEIQDNGSIRVEYNTSSYPNDWNLYEPEKIHSLAPKEPVVDYGDYSFAGRVEKNGTIAIVKHQKEECRFEVGDPVLIWGSLVSGVVVNIDKMHDFMQIPNAIGVETDGVIRYFRQDDLRVRKEPAQSAKNNRVKGMNALREKILNDKEINLMSDEELIKELFELPPMKQTGVKPEAGKVVRFSDKEEITNFICHLQFAAGYFWAINKHEQSNNLMCLVKKLMGAD